MSSNLLVILHSIAQGRPIEQLLEDPQLRDRSPCHHRPSAASTRARTWRRTDSGSVGHTSISRRRSPSPPANSAICSSDAPDSAPLAVAPPLFAEKSPARSTPTGALPWDGAAWPLRLGIVRAGRGLSSGEAGHKLIAKSSVVPQKREEEPKSGHRPRLLFWSRTHHRCVP